MSDFKIPAVLKHWRSCKSPALIALRIFITLAKPARDCRPLSLILTGAFLGFYMKTVKHSPFTYSEQHEFLS